MISGKAASPRVFGGCDDCVPDVSGYPTWVWAVIGVSVVVLGVGGYVLFRVVRHSIERRFVRGMVPQMQKIEASRRTLDTVMLHLLDDTDEALLEFASSGESADRVALFEVEQTMKLLRDELDIISLPSDIMPVAETLADAAHVIAEEAGRVHRDMDPDAALASLAEISLSRVADQTVSAALILKSACEEYRIEDAAVYGGGLYI